MRQSLLKTGIRGAAILILAAVGVGTSASPASAQIYRYETRTQTRPYRLPSGNCPVVSQFGEAPASAAGKDASKGGEFRTPVAGMLAFDGKQGPRVLVGQAGGEPLQIEIAVRNLTKKNTKGWAELAVCQVGAGDCLYSSAKLLDRRGKNRVPSRARVTAVLSTPQPLTPGVWIAHVLVFDESENLVDRWQSELFSFGQAQLRLDSVDYPRESAWIENRAGQVEPAVLRATVRNDGDAAGIAQVVFVVDGGAGAECGAEMYSAGVPVKAGGGVASVSTTWTPPRPGGYPLTILLVGAQGNVLDQRRGLRMASAPR